MELQREKKTVSELLEIAYCDLPSGVQEENIIRPQKYLSDKNAKLKTKKEPLV